MSERFQEHSKAWVTFSYASFLGACAFVAGGIFLMPVEMWIRGYLLIGMVLIVQSSINMTKTVRDNHESNQLIKRLDDAKTEKLIRDVAESPYEA